MTAVDTPPGLPFGGRAAGEFRARKSSRRIARAAFLYVVALGATTFVLATRRLGVPMIEVLMVAPLMCGSIAAVGLAVRRARVRFDGDGVWWGWAIGGIRMRTNRIRSVTVFRDAVALRPRRGSTWFLARRDWEKFDDMADALRKSGLQVERVNSPAPLRAKLHGYGVVLDGLMFANAFAVTVALLMAFAL